MATPRYNHQGFNVHFAHSNQAAGNGTLVASADVGAKQAVRIHSVHHQSHDATDDNIMLKDTGGALISGTHGFAAETLCFGMEFNPAGYYETGAGLGVVVTQSGAGLTTITYSLQDAS